MLIKELKDVIELDSHITTLHKKLAGLYAKRQTIVDTSFNLPSNISNIKNNSAQPTVLSNTSDNKPSELYRYLSSQWSEHNIALPSFNTIRKLLAKGSALQSEIYESREDLTGLMQPVLIPPTSKLQKVVDSMLDKLFVLSSDIPSMKKSSKWRMVLVYNHVDGLAFNQALDSSTYMVNTHDLRSLGLVEYIAFVLQEAATIDTEKWSLLLKDANKSKVDSVPAVTCNGYEYRFMLDDMGNIFEDNTFRPAVEVIG